MARRTNIDQALDRPWHQALPHQFILPNPQDWFDTINAVVLRALWWQKDRSEVATDLEIHPAVVDFVVQRVRDGCADPLIKKNFAKKTDSIAYAVNRMPKPLTRNALVFRAAQIGRAIFAGCVTDPQSIGRLLSVYALASNSDRVIELGSMSDRTVTFATTFIAFIDGLGVENLRIRIVEFKTDRRRTNTQDWLPVLHLLDRPLLKRELAVRNPDLPSGTNHLGLEVVRTSKSGKPTVDGAFHQAMVFGALLQPWRFVIRQSTALPAAWTPPHPLSRYQYRIPVARHTSLDCIQRSNRFAQGANSPLCWMESYTSSMSCADCDFPCARRIC